VASSEIDPYEDIATQLKHELSAVKSLGVSFRSIALDPSDPENGAECVLAEPVLAVLARESLQEMLYFLMAQGVTKVHKEIGFA